jgi:MoaA/NifB/PqqE/SkfB family radical SAM enzyme
LPVVKNNQSFIVLSSGFNFTRENARSLKQAGLTGVVISLDHFDPEKHNAFRGFNNSFNDVTRASPTCTGTKPGNCTIHLCNPCIYNLG